MVSAYRIARERVGHAVAVFRSKQDPFGPGLADTFCAAAQSHAGWAPLRGWLRWRYG